MTDINLMAEQYVNQGYSDLCYWTEHVDCEQDYETARKSFCRNMERRLSGE